MPGVFTCHLVTWLSEMAASLGYNDSDVVIVAAGRTPIGNLNGCISSLKAHELGALVIREVLAHVEISPADVAEVIMGQVCTAGVYWRYNLLFIKLQLFCSKEDVTLSIIGSFRFANYLLHPHHPQPGAQERGGGGGGRGLREELVKKNFRNNDKTKIRVREG